MSTCSPSVPCAERSAGDAFEDEFEGLTVDGAPLPHDVGDEATVMVGRQSIGAAYRGADIDPVGPDIAVNPTSRRYFNGVQPMGGPNGIGR